MFHMWHLDHDYGVERCSGDMRRYSCSSHLQSAWMGVWERLETGNCGICTGLYLFSNMDGFTLDSSLMDLPPSNESNFSY